MKDVCRTKAGRGHGLNSRTKLQHSFEKVVRQGMRVNHGE